jgi:hypothetical protein
MADNGDKLRKTLKAITESMNPPASVVVDDLAREALRRDAGLMREGETMTQFVKRVRETAKAMRLLAGNGDEVFAAGASVKQPSQLAMLGLSLEQASRAQERVEQDAAESILRARPTGPSYRRPGSAGLALEDALEDMLDRALNGPAAEDAADLLANGGRGKGDAIGPLSEAQADEYRALARRGLAAARFGTRNSRGARGRLRRQALALERTVKTRARPSEALVDEVKALVALLKR